MPPLNGGVDPAPECGADFVPAPGVEPIGVGKTQKLELDGPGLHEFQCCIHPWMRALVKVQPEE